MIFQVGDIVRLQHGWTAMVVLGFNGKGEILAQYCEERHLNWNPITQDNYDNPSHYDDQCRKPGGFVLWDGEPLKHKVYKPMPNKFRVINHSIEFNDTVGSFLSRTLDGSRFVLQFPSGQIKDFGTDQLIEVVPYTFEVEAINPNQRRYTCHYALEDGKQVAVDDLLLSQTGNFYRVKRIDTGQRNPKKFFHGQRLIKTDL